MKRFVIFMAFALIGIAVGIVCAKRFESLRCAPGGGDAGTPLPAQETQLRLSGSNISVCLQQPDAAGATFPTDSRTTLRAPQEYKSSFVQDGKMETPLSDAEFNVKRTIEEEVRKTFPTHRVTFDKIQTMTGWLLSENADYVTFSESYGSSGTMSVKLKRQRINYIEKLTNTVPVITRRDVRVSIEFPWMTLYKRKPYTILTDESFFKVELIVKTLQSLYSEFIDIFGTLVLPEAAGRDDIQVLSFSKETDFRKRVPTEAIAGLYSANEDRLLVYNMSSADWVARSMAHIGAEEARHRDFASRNSANATQLKAWKKGAENEIAWRAREETLFVIRHEGAHQLFCNMGILPPPAPARLWLTEGLAAFCEPEHVGARNVNRITGLKNILSGGPITFESVLNLDSESATAYCEYWGAVHFLIQSPLRNRFYDYIRFIRDPANFEEIRKTPAIELFCTQMNISREELETRWKKYLASL